MTARICVVGAGRLGAVNAAGLAELGHTVHAVDIDATRVRKFQSGSTPFHEPGLGEAVQRHMANGILQFSTDIALGVGSADYVFLAIDTPPRADGSADLSNLMAGFESATPHLRARATAVVRSTVPPGTNARLVSALRRSAPDSTVAVVSNPEFLREGLAMEDFLRPDRIVVGSGDRAAARAVAQLYEPLGRPTLITGPETAEIIKYASNAFLAMSISFINEIANICERTGADIEEVTRALRLDRRIGAQAYLSPGIGFGGSCLPKDVAALNHTASERGYEPQLLRAITDVNDAQAPRLLELLTARCGELSGLTVAVLGLSFKGGTFDLRSSPALTLIELLTRRGAAVKAFDPLWDDEAAAELGAGVELCSDAYRAAAGADALVIATDHPDFATLDLKQLRARMANAILLDGRYMIDPAKATEAGFTYAALGRQSGPK